MTRHQESGWVPTYLPLRVRVVARGPVKSWQQGTAAACFSCMLLRKWKAALVMRETRDGFSWLRRCIASLRVAATQSVGARFHPFASPALRPFPTASLLLAEHLLVAPRAPGLLLLRVVPRAALLVAGSAPCRSPRPRRGQRSRAPGCGSIVPPRSTGMGAGQTLGSRR